MSTFRKPPFLILKRMKDLKRSWIFYRYHKYVVNQSINISQEDIIELTITDHLLWRWKIYNLILGFENMTELDVGLPRESRLGQWYYGKGRELLGNERAFKELEQPHLEVHEIARKAVNAYNDGDKRTAEQYLQQLADASHLVIERLQELQKIILDQKKTHMK